MELTGPPHGHGIGGGGKVPDERPKREGEDLIGPSYAASPSRNPASCATTRESPVKADPEVDAVRPEVRPPERINGSRGGDRSRVRDEVRDAGHVQHCVDLVAGPDDAAPVEE